MMLIGLTASFCWYGCGIYSFTGASVAPDVKTISIDYLQNRASIIVPTLSQDLTEKLRDKFTAETSLSLIEKGGDLELSGAITRYHVTPIAPKGDETSSLSRLTIKVKVDFVNHKHEEENWNQSFSRYADFDSQVDLSSVEEQLIAEINDQLIQDIFNKAVVNW